MCTVQDLLRKAVFDQRKKHLWQKFGKDYSVSSSMDKNAALELLEASQKVDMAVIDKQVESFFDESNELQIAWDELFKHQLPPFTHCVTFSDNDDGLIYYIVYVKYQDMFLSFKLQNQMFKEPCVLVPDQNIRSGCDRDVEGAVATIVDQFINHVTKWMFMSSCRFSVT
jgi:hypothetical protein